MKGWKTCVLSAVLLTSCAKTGGSADTKGTPDFACGVLTEPLGQIKSTPQDPFEAFGKVIIENNATRTNFAANFPSALLANTFSAADRVLTAGSELTVDMLETCTIFGPLTKIVRDQNSNARGDHVSDSASVRSYNWRLEADISIPELHRLAMADACVVGISDSPRAQISESFDDPLVPTQGHLKSLGVTDPATQKELETAAKSIVTIAVIDTGIEMNHEDLKNILWLNPGEIAANGIDDDNNGYIDDVNGFNFATNTGSPQYLKSVSGYQHGTHVSGLAAAQGHNGLGGAGIMSSGARIMMLNVFASSEGASTSDIANAIRYAADNGASVINISLGGTGKSASYESAILYAIKKGVTIFAAAGNEHSELGPNYWMSPGSYGQQFDGMMSVGSIDSANGSLSSYSNYSATYVEIAAPGSEDSKARLGLLSTWPGNTYARIQGTSMSSPVAAGAAALAISMMRERGYSPSPATVEAIMAAASIHTPALYGYISGGRVLNVKSLVDFINTTYPYRTGAHIDPGVPGFKACGHAS
jgi:hypothetical protein